MMSKATDRDVRRRAALLPHKGDFKLAQLGRDGREKRTILRRG